MEHPTPQALQLTHSVESPADGVSAVEVAILLCTYNGRPFLKEQIESFIAQTHKNWTLYVSDDGSSDGTLAVFEEYRNLIATNRIKIFAGPRTGFAQNFISLIRNDQIIADYFAFSDQDDIWFQDKLERSIDQLKLLPQNLPAMYCSRTRLIDENRNIIGYSPKFIRNPNFQNALIQSIAGANTMLINNSTRKLLNCIPADINIIAHDWLTYLLTSGCGGTVIYDIQPTLDYRQHSGNVIGANTGIKERIIRFGKVIDGQFRNWSDSNLKVLDCVETELTATSRKTINEFKQGRESNFFKRIYLLKKSGIYRQTLKGNISLCLAILFNKI
ncbi:glycosyltransferase family 2 protein [Pseudomonas sp. SWRI153]|uniref:Glycosyltransferase family 2 protein n=1 Tax=Pseudomonas khorasanensis TaxID=2745508 RepID=A0A923F1P8_9PSED|nr:glycosyltransferase family 2 protein [Pseudomonas khorasanensis]MBV4485767.1 glycosyltransferase family 2 protein [Pseudomonas khorasanensis]